MRISPRPALSRDRSNGDPLKAPKQNSNDDQLYQYRLRVASAVAGSREGRDGHDGEDGRATSIDRAGRGGGPGPGPGGDAARQVERAGGRSGSSDSGAGVNPGSNPDRSAYRAGLLVQLLLAGSAGGMDGTALRVELPYGRAGCEGPVSGLSGLQTGLAVYPAAVEQHFRRAGAGLNGSETMHLVCLQLVLCRCALR